MFSSRCSTYKPSVLLISLTAILLVGMHLESAVAGPIADTWVQATVKIENEWTSSGTGFLVIQKLKTTAGKKEFRKIFLVTNKHVVNEDAIKRRASERLTLFVNVRRNDGNIIGFSFGAPLRQQGKPLWREHPNTDVDVLAVDVTELVVLTPEIKNKWVPESFFVTRDVLDKEDISIGEKVLIVGYPSGLAHARTNYPLVRQGIIATRIGEPIALDVEESPGKVKRVEIPGFLVDAAIIPGSSGSPVVLKPLPTRFIKGNTVTIIGGPRP